MNWQLAKGYVIIQIEGNSAERMLNSMRAASIPVRDARQNGRSRIECVIEARFFKSLRSISRKCGCRVRIMRRSGLPFFLWALRFRKTVWIGSALMIALLAFMSTRIWIIPVTGHKTVPEQVIRRALTQYGIYPGALRGGLALHEAADQVRVYDSRIAWVGLDLDGVCCSVQIVEAEPMGETLDQSVPTDVIAAKDGIITRIEALNGHAAVAEGALVYAGDVIVRGDITQEGAEERLLVHAHGEVLARVYYFAEAAVETACLAPADTGVTAAYRKVTLLGLTVSETVPAFDDYEVRALSHRAVFGTLLPVALVTGTCYERTEQPAQRTRAECASLASAEAERRAYERLPTAAAIVEKFTTYAEHEGCTVAVCCIVTEESIGLIKEITS